MPPPANSHDDLTGAEEAVETPVLETDGGPPRAGKAGAREAAQHENGRRCIATLERRPQAAMIRYVLSPDGAVAPDLAARLPGRGAWVTSSREAVELAVKRGAFSRAFKMQAKAGPELAAQVEQLLVRRLMDQLGMAKRAGDLILGFEQVREWVRGEQLACLIEASDGSGDQRGKVLGLLRAVHGPDLDPDDRPEQGELAGNRELPPVIGCFSADELGMALGRGRVIHACLKHGRIAHAWMGELARLSGFRRVWLEGWPPTKVTLESAAGRNIEGTQARVSGGNPPDTPAATEVSE
jgi:hypothetical protein